MGKFDGILLWTDLDGTLFRDDKTVSDENIEAIEKELSNIQEELSKPQNMSDYILLSELSEKSKQLEQELEKKLAEWEELSILYDSWQYSL